MKSFSLTVASALLVLMCGCAAQKKPKAPASAAAHATAPTLPEAAAPAEKKPAVAAGETEPKPAPNHEQQDDTLIAASKKAYDSGVALYQSGQYAAARAEFNRAFDIFLTSGRDLKKDAKLNAAFEDTVDKINSLEMDALEQSNGFSQQDQTPVSVANGVTFPVDPNLLARAQADLKSTRSDLPLVVNDYVASYINYFTNTRKGHNTIENSLAREGRYRAAMEKILADAGLPKDLIYLAVAESGFRPRAVDRRSGAGGMWQFMPHGDYGLVRNGWVDERFDPVKSTEAYARYIKELHQQFGDWYLAMAAYDWGPGKVQRAVQRTGYADFWQLYQRNVLPAETKNYVPIILAAAIMAKNPTQYGLGDIPQDPPVESDTVTTHSEINLSLVADLAGTTVDEIQQLNPALLRMSTPRDMDYQLHLPPGTGKLFEQRLATVPEEHRESWRFHIAGPDETLASVADTYHVRVRNLEAANGIEAGAALHTGEALLIPVPPAPVRTERMRYRVRRGDTIVTVADRFGVTTGQLRRWNRVRSYRLPVGRLLYVSEPVRGRVSRRYRYRRRTMKSDPPKQESASNHRSHVERKSVHSQAAHSTSAGKRKARRKKSEAD